MNDYNIDIFKLSNETHNYQFEIDSAFFELFPEQIVEQGAGSVDIELIKSDTLIDLKFDINVTVRLECDRSLEPFDHKITSTRGLILKFGEEEEEIDDEMVIIPRDKQRINLAQYIYEFIGLAIPMKKLHPKFDNEDDSDEIVYTSDKEEEKQDNNEAIDPRWQALRKLK
nr:DUF177 domain-containing protein [Fulvivirga aurantia]